MKKSIGLNSPKIGFLMARRPKSGNEREKNLYHICTTGGNVVYHASDLVTVQISPRAFVQKKVRDLNTGETVLYDVRHVRTTLEDVEPHLSRSPMYARATDYVHERNSKGELIPRFRIALLKSLALQGIIGDENLEKKLMRDGFDFSRTEYEESSGYVVSLLQESLMASLYGTPAPKHSTVNNWIRGKTLAPRDHRTFEVLQEEFGPEFDKFVTTDLDDMSGFYKNYKIYVVMRQAIMRALNSWRGIGRPWEPSEERDTRVNVTKEVHLIRSHFIRDITQTLKSVMITDIDRLSQGQAYDRRRKDRLMGEGIIRGEISELTSNMKDYNRVLEEMLILEDYFQKAVATTNVLEETDRVSILARRDGRIESYPQDLTRKILFRFVLPHMMEAFGEKLDSDYRYMYENRGLFDSAVGSGVVDRFLDSSKESILNYSLDRSLKFGDGTMISLLESIFRLRRALPSTLFRHIRNCREASQISGLTPEKKSELNRKISRSQRELSRDYHIQMNREGGVMKGGLFLSADGEAEAVMLGHPGAQGLVEGLLSDRSRLLEFLDSLPKGVFIRTRDYTAKVLSEYGFEEIVDLRKDDFRIEAIGLDFPKPPEEFALS